MPVAQKLVGGLVMIGLVTTMVLPKRQTAKVINAATRFVGKTLGTAITGKY
jgi:hypothetical protein